MRFVLRSAMCFAFLASAVVSSGGSPVAAHTTSEYADVSSPFSGSASVKWGFAGDSSTVPANHHIVYQNWGYYSDWSVDLYSGVGTQVVSPFTYSTLSNSQPLKVTVVEVRAGCKSGVLADGGYLVTLEAKNATTGVVIGRVSLMHVDRPVVKAGQILKPSQHIGYTAQFRKSGCYAVSTTAGVHIHMEVSNKHRYSCYENRSTGSSMSGMSRVGKLGAHYTAQRARC